uniref:hypothetical protein n=1 Tax=Flavobacterium sp. TaxID=239 RepID=UPI0040494505
MKQLSLCILLVLVQSCQFFDAKVPDEKQLLEERLEQINWQEVTVYPSLPSCDKYYDKAAKKDCFFESMQSLLQGKLQPDTLSFLQQKTDTLWVKITIKPDASLVFEPQVDTFQEPEKTTVLDLINAQLVNFPPIEPAQKDGIPVTTQFLLPIVVKTEIH